MFRALAREILMANHIRHFAIHADDVDRARRFYEAAFGWHFEAWGPPGFYLIRTGTESDPGLQGALQERQAPLSGTGMRGFECTIGVADLEEIMAKVTEFGGKLLSQPYRIDGVGRLSFFEDTEGNKVGIMQYEAAYPL
jgi:predicted enzyme related to lactoylglutathione lyase